MAFATSPSTPVLGSARALICTPLCPRRSISTPSPSTLSPGQSAPLRMVQGQTVKQTLQSNPSYSKFVALAAVAGVDLDLSGCTLFIPGNYAFSQLRSGHLEELMSCPDSARSVVERHILPGRVLTSKQIKGSGFWDGIPGGPMPYQTVGPITKVANIALAEKVDDECDNGTIHTLSGVIFDSPMYKPPSVNQYFSPSVPNMEMQDSTIAALNPTPMSGYLQRRAAGAASSPSTVGARKAMGLIRQLPFWQYGPPFNAAKQEDYEPISIAQPEVAGIDYQLMPPGSVVVTSEEVASNKLNPISGMSKYIGQTRKMVGGDAESTYSKLDE